VGLDDKVTAVDGHHLLRALTALTAVAEGEAVDALLHERLRRCLPKMKRWPGDVSCCHCCLTSRYGCFMSSNCVRESDWPRDGVFFNGAYCCNLTSCCHLENPWNYGKLLSK